MVVFVHALFDAVQGGNDDGREIRENSGHSDETFNRAVQHIAKKFSQHDILLVMVLAHLMWNFSQTHLCARSQAQSLRGTGARLYDQGFRTAIPQKTYPAGPA